MDLTALASFNRIAEHGGIGRASRATGASKATLSRHIRTLEDELGVRLVERGSRTLHLTDAGTTLHARTGGLLDEIREVVEDIAASAEHPRGRLRVSVPILFAHMATSRIAEGFAKSYPEIRLDLSADDRNVDIIAEGYDVVVRVDPRPDQNLVGRCFLKDQRVVVAAPQHACPDLGAHGSFVSSVPAVVRSGEAEPPVWQVRRNEGTIEIRPEPVLRVSTLLMMRDAVRAGIGAAVLPQSLVADDLAAGHVVAWGGTSDRPVELWALHTSRRLVSAKVEAFVGFLCSTFEASTRV